MAKISAKDAILLVAGYDLSIYGTKYDAVLGVDPIDVSGFNEGAHNSIPGQFVGKIDIDFLWDKAAGKTYPVLKTLLAGDQVTFFPEGYTLGCQSFSMPVMQGAFNPQGSPQTAIALGNINFESYGNNAGLEAGVGLHHSVITDTTTGTAVRDAGEADLTASKSSGTIHVWTAVASDTYEVKIEHSTNGTTSWTTLLTFTVDGSAIGSERIAVAAGAIKQYRRVVATRTGASGDDFGFTVHFWRDPLGV